MQFKKVIQKWEMGKGVVRDLITNSLPIKYL